MRKTDERPLPGLVFTFYIRGTRKYDSFKNSYRLSLDIYGIVIAPDSPLKVGTLGKTIGNANKIVKRGVNWHQK